MLNLPHGVDTPNHNAHIRNMNRIKLKQPQPQSILLLSSPTLPTFLVVAPFVSTTYSNFDLSLSFLFGSFLLQGFL